MQKLILAAAVATALGAGAGAALAQDKGTKPGAQPAQPAQNKPQSARLVATNWQLDCRPLGPNRVVVCDAFKRISLAQNQRQLMALFVKPTDVDKKKRKFILQYQLPHGLNLTAGIKVQVDKKDIEPPVILTTNQAGVFARTALDKTLTDTLSKGEVMTVQFSGLNGSNFSVPVALGGFGDIFAKMQ